MSETPKAIAPVDTTAVQLDRTDPTYPGQVKVEFKLRFDSTTTFSYFNPADLSWNAITDSAISGDKGFLTGDFVNPIQHTTYLQMRTNFAEQFLNGSLKIRVNVVVAGQGSSNAESPVFRLDTKNPANTSFILKAQVENDLADLTISMTDDSPPVLMKICNNTADAPGCSFEAYATSKNNWNIAGASSVYITFRDFYYNDTTIFKAVVAAPGNVQVKDASNITTGKYRLVIIWDDAVGAAHYNIWRAIYNETGYSQLDETTKNGYLDNGLDHTKRYSYKVMSENAIGDISPPVGVVGAQPGTAPGVTQDPQVELFGWKQEFGVRAKVTWNTDQLSDSFVIYANEDIETGTSTKTKTGKDASVAGAVSMVTSHEVWLYNLEPQTKYYFKALSKNEIQIAGYSNVLSFTTPERIPLLISGMKISDITMTGALVDWDTTKAATTVLEYGPSTSYGKSATDVNFNVDHTFKLDNLDSGVSYNLRASVTDADGNTTVSDNYVFETPAMPIVTSVSVGTTTFDTATINWTTNVNTDSNIEYGVSTLSGTQGKADSTQIHSVTLIGLEAKTAYSFRALSKDKFGNSATSPTGSFTTQSDTQAPKIDNVQSEVTSTGAGETVKYQAVISWETDEPASSQIEYSAGISGDYAERTKEDLSLNSTHVVILPDLKPNSAYHFRIVSKDKAGNQGVSDDISLITPPKEKSLLSVILKSLEDTFSWVGRLREKWFNK